MAEIRERHNRLIGDIDHTLQGNVWMGELLKRMGQDHDIKPVGREAVQAVIDIFLNILLIERHKYQIFCDVCI